MLKDTYEHRRRLSGINLRLGPYADRYDHERHTNKHLDLKKHRVRRRRALREKLKSAPTSFDWRNFGFETPIPVQGDCGGCFAFAATTVLEYWDPVRRSCHICSGRDGLLLTRLEALTTVVKADSWKMYSNTRKYMPYCMTTKIPTSQKIPCRTGSVHVASSFGTLSIDDDPRAEDHIAWLVAHYGPVAVSVDSTSDAFQNYAGIFQDP